MEDEDLEEKILKKLDEFFKRKEGITIAEYIEMVRSPKRMILINFLLGLARGFGIAVGATLLGGLFLFILFRLARLNLPVIGKFIAELVLIVESYLQ
ncbi:MAG: DUF5665 domain-containing protein [Candidatus Woesearchaeota archaeon]